GRRPRFFPRSQRRARRGPRPWARRGLRRTVEELCDVFDIPFDAARRAELEAMSRDQLEALLARLKRERSWV
ncbi:MAG: hypothetical protein HC897_01155, partial [Thermoanaerobaculia bacterium]|nr:hypothetical protein [Thermoanaerobaculia bacterium]